MTPMIELEGLTKQFPSITAVNGLSFTVGKGEIFGIVGPDGAGKTTTLRIVCGLVNPTSGSVRVTGLDVTKETEAVKDRIGYMAQKFGLYPDLTVQENMLFYADLFGITGEERNTLAVKLLEMTRMLPFRDRHAGKLSGGMKQKLALMCTLLHKPEVLILDEPTNGVDPVSRRDFWKILRQLVAEGLTVFVTTAYLDEAELCDRVGLMNAGRLILLDTPKALKEGLAEACYELRAENARAIRDTLRGKAEVADVELAGSKLHVFLRPGASDEVLRQTGSEYRRILPSLEDVFIATVRKEALRAA
ncbi:MAG: ABC transporter ATP-binding protein [Bryobacterales bacterium]|nr:ABC transporter ATP-binding protein [Bryobacterales bacterium]